MATNENHQNAILDNQHNRALIGHSGTAGTAGTATTRRIVVTPGGAITTDTVETTDLECGTIPVGTAATQVTFTGITQGIMIQSDHDNNREMFVGTANVDKLGANAMARLEAGESVSIDLNDASAAIWVCGGTTALKAFKSSVI